MYYKGELLMLDIYQTMWSNRRMIYTLSLQEMKRVYAGTLLGVLWALINPLIRIAVYWFVFSIGARAGSPVNGVPYLAWLSGGLTSWFFINEGFKLGKNSFRSKRHIIKNTPFPVAILPAVQVLYAYFTHLIFLSVMFIIMAFSLQSVSIYWLQILYYDFAAFILLVAIGSVMAPLVAVSKDLGRFLDTILIFLFWMTPIFWRVENVGPNLERIIKLNPFHYIVNGYRESFFFEVGFWEHPYYTLYFWLLVLVLLFIGNYLFKRMKPIFLDIL